MNLSELQKKQILRGFLDIIPRVASKDYQKRVWIRGEGPEVDSFDDVANEFFIEVDSIIENYKEFWLTDNQQQILKIFRDKFDKFSRKNSWPPEFIDTPEWTEITEMAKAVLKAFNYDKLRQ